MTGTVVNATVVTEGGPVHLRTVPGPHAAAGRPPMVLLHQSPLSSKRFAPLLTELGRWTAALAPDTPGYGESPRLADHPTVADLAQVLWQAIDHYTDHDTKGPVRLLGRATGSVLAVEMAAQQSDRVEHLILHGLPVYTAEEAADRLANFAPCYRPDDDGSHLSWIWRRISDEYPWASAELRTQLVGDYLMAGPDFATAYRAIWRYDLNSGLDAVALAGIPVSLIAGGADRIGFMHERARERLPRAAERVIGGATDFVAEQDPAGFSDVIRELVGAGEPIKDEGE